MPLKRGSSKETVSENISECMHSGKHKHSQCIAMSMESARKSGAKLKRRKKG